MLEAASSNLCLGNHLIFHVISHALEEIFGTVPQNRPLPPGARYLPTHDLGSPVHLFHRYVTSVVETASLKQPLFSVFLTPWSRVLEKLIVTHLAKKYSTT